MLNSPFFSFFVLDGPCVVVMIQRNPNRPLLCSGPAVRPVRRKFSGVLFSSHVTRDLHVPVCTGHSVTFSGKCIESGQPTGSAARLTSTRVSTCLAISK